jgi:hypothetical protein
MNKSTVHIEGSCEFGYASVAELPERPDHFDRFSAGGHQVRVVLWHFPIDRTRDTNTLFCSTLQLF